MIKIKLLCLGIMLSLVGASNVFAEQKSETKTIAQANEKSGQKPKEEVCKECGKPESKCECKDEGKDHKEDGHKH